MKALSFVFPLILLNVQPLLATPRVIARDENSITRAIAVRLNDIDPVAPDAAKRLRKRLRKAAAAVCRAPLLGPDAIGWDAHGCYVATLRNAAAAVAQVKGGAFHGI